MDWLWEEVVLKKQKLHKDLLVWGEKRTTHTTCYQWTAVNVHQAQHKHNHRLYGSEDNRHTVPSVVGDAGIRTPRKSKGCWRPGIHCRIGWIWDQTPVQPLTSWWQGGPYLALLSLGFLTSWVNIIYLLHRVAEMNNSQQKTERARQQHEFPSLVDYSTCQVHTDSVKTWEKPAQWFSRLRNCPSEPKGDPPPTWVRVLPWAFVPLLCQTELFPNVDLALCILSTDRSAWHTGGQQAWCHRNSIHSWVSPGFEAHLPLSKLLP